MSRTHTEYVTIASKVYPVDTDTQQKIASRALSRACVNSASVWRLGVKTHLVLLADTDVDPIENGTADALDYEQRWLAECRAHGETRRKLMLAHHELGDHSLCDADCDAERSEP